MGIDIDGSHILKRKPTKSTIRKGGVAPKE